jgi:hypothetical protein
MVHTRLAVGCSCDWLSSGRVDVAATSDSRSSHVDIFDVLVPYSISVITKSDDNAQRLGRG